MNPPSAELLRLLRRQRAPWWSQLLLAAVIAAAAAWAMATVLPSDGWRYAGLFVTLGALGVWRWSWGGLHYLRAAVYRYWAYPRLRDRALKCPPLRSPTLSREEHPDAGVVVLATTYHELPWITREVIRGVLREFHDLPSHAPRAKLVFVTGCDEDDAAVTREFDAAATDLRAAASRCLDAPAGTAAWPPELVLLRGENGKRQAIAAGLKQIAAAGVHPDAAVVLMDGDSVPEPGVLARVLPLFRLGPRIGAVTTNERAVLDAPLWFTEWIRLRFGQRHLYMCSLALSHKLLCLTGRFSVFRGAVAADPRFIDQIENDGLGHWLFGRYRMFSGDDKSSWYWLAAHGFDMLYAPDAMVTTYETAADRPLTRAVANMRRWSGNMLRNSGRAISLGPRRLGWFPWLCTVDQRLSMWTVLVGPTATLLAVLAGDWQFAACYLIWLLATRTCRVAAAWRHGRRISLWYLPLQLFSEWVGGAVKVWVFFHPVKQTWFNRGNRTLDSSRATTFPRVRRSLATCYCAAAAGLFVLAVGCYTGLLPIAGELRLVFPGAPAPQTAAPALVESPLPTGRPVYWGGPPEDCAAPPAALTSLSQEEAEQSVTFRFDQERGLP